MSTILEDVLKQKTTGTTSEILYSQWVFDKQLIPGALSEISNIFPHYSLHDQSHSNTIINNIVRVIGEENINKLSSIDIWLILQAAYYHDTGMVTSGADLKQTIDHKKFIFFFESLLEDPSHSLHEYAINFEIKEDQIHLKSTLQDVSVQEGFKFILAEYFRRVHAQRSENVVNDPEKELAIRSPRTIIPSRIWTILGKICSLHTADFSEVIELPFKMVGIDVEDAHPRLVAGLLRIGDLLDLDNNRFSEVMLKTLTQIPIDTLNHKEKHLSIEVFSVSNELINITAKCKDYSYATLAHHWFSYLRSEISNQTLFWNKISPSSYNITLPSIESLNVVLKNYKYIEKGKMPSFSISSNKALKIIQGANIYTSEFQALREILQNATDATLLRLWLDICELGLDEEMKSPNQKFYELAASLPITVNVTKSELTENDSYIWTISICDQGVGLSFNDIKHLVQSNSNSNNDKKELIRSMPNWMRPSGVFGIGFQSTFLLCDKIAMETKSYQTQEFHKLILHSPSSKYKGDVYLSEEHTSFSKKPGTVLTFNYETKRIGDYFTVPTSNRRADDAMSNFDPFVSESLDIEIMTIVDEVERFSIHSIIPINIIFEGDKETFNQKENIQFEQFDQDTGIAFSIYKISPISGNIYCQYKNQPVENRAIESIPFIDLDVNFMYGPASKVLQLSRNTFLGSFRRETTPKLAALISNHISKNFAKYSGSEEEKNFASLSIEYQNVIRDFKIESYDHWKNIALCDGFTLAQMPSLEKLKVEIIANQQAKEFNYFLFENGELTFRTSEYNSPNDLYDFFFRSVFDHQPFELTDFSVETREYDPIQKQAEIISFTLNKKGTNSQYLPDEVIEFIISKLKHSSVLFSRLVIPCPLEFSVLRIKDDARQKYTALAKLNHAFTPDYARMIAPFVLREQRYRQRPSKFKISIPESLINWVFDNRFDDNTTIDQIRNGYNEIIRNDLFKLI